MLTHSKQNSNGSDKRETAGAVCPTDSRTNTVNCLVFEPATPDVTAPPVLSVSIRQAIDCIPAPISIPLRSIKQAIGSRKPEEAVEIVTRLAGKTFDADLERGRKRTAAQRARVAVRQVMQSGTADLARWVDQKIHSELLCTIADRPQLLELKQVPIWILILVQLAILFTCLVAELSSCVAAVRNAGIGFAHDDVLGPMLFSVVFVVGPTVGFEFAGRCLFRRNRHRFLTSARFVTVPLTVSLLFIFAHKMGSASDSIDVFSPAGGFEIPMWVLTLSEMLFLSLVVLVLPTYIAESRDKLWPRTTVTSPEYLHISREEQARARFLAECQGLIDEMDGVIRDLDAERAGFIEVCLGELYTTRARFYAARRNQHLRLLADD